MKKLLITGSRGMLGSAIGKLFASRYQIIEGTSSSLNLHDYKTVKQFVSDAAPDIIIHAAAYTNVEAAETDPEGCYKTNFTGTINLINSIGSSDCKLIYISSTGCYGTHKDTPYAEYDDVLPTTVYHRSKFLGEKQVASLHDNFLILRTGWLFGGATSHKKNFVYNRMVEASGTERMVSDPFQKGNPTNVEDVAAQIELLIREDVHGTFNVVSEGEASRYEYVKFIIENAGIACRVDKTDAPFVRKAKVSPNESASNFNLREMGLCTMPHWQETLASYIRSINMQTGNTI